MSKRHQVGAHEILGARDRGEEVLLVAVSDDHVEHEVARRGYREFGPVRQCRADACHRPSPAEGPNQRLLVHAHRERRCRQFSEDFAEVHGRDQRPLGHVADQKVQGEVGFGRGLRVHRKVEQVARVVVVASADRGDAAGGREHLVTPSVEPVIASGGCRWGSKPDTTVIEVCAPACKTCSASRLLSL